MADVITEIEINRPLAEGMTLTFAFPLTTTLHCHPERAPVEAHIDVQPSEGSYGVHNNRDTCISSWQVHEILHWVACRCKVPV